MKMAIGNDIKTHSPIAIVTFVPVSMSLLSDIKNAALSGFWWKMAGAAGLEPATSGFGDRRSTN